MNRDKRTLIVYYSNTGHTLRAAEAIKGLVGGTLCGIYPRQPYPIDPHEMEVQIRREQKEGYVPGLLPLKVKPEVYERVYLGTPNWHGRIAPPLIALMAKWDFSGKILIPFCTCTGESIARMRDLVQAGCPGAYVLEGFSVRNDDEKNLRDTIKNKLKRIWTEEISNEKKKFVIMYGNWSHDDNERLRFPDSEYKHHRSSD